MHAAESADESPELHRDDERLRNCDSDVQHKRHRNDHDRAEYFDVRQPGGGNDERDADGDGDEYGRHSCDVHQHRDQRRFCRRDAGAMHEHSGGRRAVRIFDHVQAYGDGNAYGSDHVYGQCYGKPTNGDVDGNGHARRGDGDGDAEQSGVRIAGADYDERAAQRDGEEYGQHDGDIQRVHDQWRGCGRLFRAAAYFWCGMQCDGNAGGRSELHDQRGVRAGSKWSAHGDIEHRGQCDGKSADCGVERNGRYVAGDHLSSAGRIDDGDDCAGRNGVLRIGDSGSGGN